MPNDNSQIAKETASSIAKIDIPAQSEPTIPVQSEGSPDYLGD